MTAGKRHVAALAAAVTGMDVSRLEAWGRVLAEILHGGGRLLVAGNGGSAAEAQHLTAELVGRFRDDRRPLSALALHSDSSSMTAIGNDFGYDEVFARQVQAHGRAGDVLLTLSTSGASANLLRATETAQRLGIATWALTGPAPNALASLTEEFVAITAPSSATVQECHLAAVHVLCGATEDALALARAAEHPSTDGLPGGLRLPVVENRELAESGPGTSPSQSRRLVVVGDTVLDRDTSGNAERLSPEGAAPVVSNPQTVARPGGAGLAAVMAAREPGWAVTLVTALGADQAGDEARRLLGDAGVDLVDIGAGDSTGVKWRIRADGRTLLRVDDNAATVRHDELPATAYEAIAAAWAVLVCDYGRGITAHSGVRAALAGAAQRTPVVWDPHPRGAPPVDGVALVVPNSSEARGAVGEVQGRGLSHDVQCARRLLNMWPVRHVAITRAGAGAVLVHDGDAPPLVVPAQSLPAGDACGAGDQFAVTATMLLGVGRLPSEAVTGAVEAASGYVARGGPATLTADRGTTEPDGLDAIERVRARGGCVVATGGCFDLLHIGHVALLEQARRLGDCLVVCLNTDASIARLKGSSRPLVPEQERAAMLRALASVDAVILFEEDTPEQLLARVRPDIYVKGGDYAIGRIPESALVQSWGGQVVLVPYLAGRSTTSLIEEAVRREAVG